MRLLHLSLIAAVIGLWLAVSWSGAQEAGDTQEQADPKPKHGIKLPAVFNFQAYKQMFRKHYSGLLEELVRQKILLGRVFQSFMSVFMFKQGQASHFLRINHMSDDTPEERRRRFMRVNSVRRRANRAKPDTDQVLMTGEADLIAEFSRIEEHKSEPGYRELAKEFEELANDAAPSARRRRRSLAEPEPDSTPETRLNPREMTTSDLIKPRTGWNTGVESTEIRKKLTARVPSNNPLHTTPELASSSSGATPTNSRELRALSGTSQLEAVRRQLNKVVNRAVASPKREPKSEKRREKPDKMFIDHRKKNCFMPVKDQAYCGSCYAFTAISLYEYLFCMETGHLVPFSEQFIVDCGERRSLGACEGAEIDDTMSFMEEFGMELAADYPYLGQNGTCPYDTDTSPAKMGAVKVDRRGANVYDVKHLDTLLETAPVAIAVWLGPDFNEYGGGVDMGEKCLDQEELHAMLIVGSGRENGVEYYLFRNSYGPSWGEDGYYKFAKSGVNKCVDETRNIFFTDASFKRYAKMTKRQKAKILGDSSVERQSSERRRKTV